MCNIHEFVCCNRLIEGKSFSRFLLKKAGDKTSVVGGYSADSSFKAEPSGVEHFFEPSSTRIEYRLGSRKGRHILGRVMKVLEDRVEDFLKLDKVRNGIRTTTTTKSQTMSHAVGRLNTRH